MLQLVPAQAELLILFSDVHLPMCGCAVAVVFGSKFAVAVVFNFCGRLFFQFAVAVVLSDDYLTVVS